MVDDRPLRLRCALVGDDCPELREAGLNSAVAGDPESREGEAKGVDPSCPVDGRAGSPVTIEGRDEVELREVEEDTPGKAGVLDRWGRCPRGKSGSGCFCLRRRRKKPDAFELVCGVNTPFSLTLPKLPSDLDDSDKRSTGGTKAALWLSALLLLLFGGIDVEGLAGSSKVTVCLLVDDMVRSFIVFLFSFFAIGGGRTLGADSCSPLGKSLDRRIRRGIFIRVCFLGWLFKSMVGAVVMIAGAKHNGKIRERVLGWKSFSAETEA